MSEEIFYEEKSKIFSFKQVIIILIISSILLFIVHRSFTILLKELNIYAGDYWPTYIIRIIPPDIFTILISVSIFIFFLFCIKFFPNKDFKFNLFIITIMGLVLIIFTNLIHGIIIGLELPMTENNNQLYNDAILIENPFVFLRDFEQNQKYLTTHARTHPPGAVLLLYLLYKIFFFPSLISIAISVISTISSSFFLSRILMKRFSEEITLYLVFLYLLIPSIQIYYLANLYAIVTSLFLGIIYYYWHLNGKKSMIGTIICFFLLTFISFLFIYFLSVFIVFEIFNSKSIKNLKKISIISFTIIIIYILFLFIFNFNYINSFLIASTIENPQGFRLFVNPFNYFYTRLEDILDIIIFFGPFLTILLIKGFRSMRDYDYEFYLFSLVSLVMLLLLFLSGAYRTGETARGCLYIYPVMLFPIGTYLQNLNPSNFEKKKLLILVFGQSLIMQFLGYYLW